MNFKRIILFSIIGFSHYNLTAQNLPCVEFKNMRATISNPITGIIETKYEGEVIGLPEGKGRMTNSKGEILQSGHYVSGQYSLFECFFSEDFDGEWRSKIVTTQIPFTPAPNILKVNLKSIEKIPFSELTIPYFNYSEDGKYLYIKFKGNNYIFRSDKLIPSKINIDSLEKSYSTKFRLFQKQNVVNQYSSIGADFMFSRYYFGDGKYSIRTNSNEKNGSIIIHDYLNCRRNGEYILTDGSNSSDEYREYNKAQTKLAEDQALQATANYLEGGSGSDFFIGLLKAAFIDGIVTSDTPNPFVGKPYSVAVSPTQNYLAVSFYGNKNLYLWNFNKESISLDTSDPAFTLTGHKYVPKKLLFDLTGQYLISSANRLIPNTPLESVIFETVIWNLEKKRKILQLEDFVAHSLSPDGKYLIASRSIASITRFQDCDQPINVCNTQLKLIEVATGKIVLTINLPIEEKFKKIKNNIVQAEFDPTGEAIYVMMSSETGTFKFNITPQLIRIDFKKLI